MQRGVRVYIDDILNKVEQNLVGVEKLVLGMEVSLRCMALHCIVMNYQCPSARPIIVTCWSKYHLVFCTCTYVCKCRSYC